MPDIFKGAGYWKEEESTVRIPDVSFPGPGSPDLSSPEEDEAEKCPDTDSVETEGPEGGKESQPPETPQTVEIPRYIPPEPHRMSRLELADYYRAELNDIREEVSKQACRDAQARALAEKRQEIADCLAQVEGVLGQMQELQRQYIESYTHELKYLAVDIAEKLIQAKIEEDGMTLQNLVMQSVNQVKKADWLKVEISEGLAGLVDHLKEELAKAEYQGKVEVVAAPWPKDTCRVSTEDGTIVATVSVQAENLRQAFIKADTEKGRP
ncbi:MAG: FliH/SctL family protein [Peptococcaceae bacterium]|nr:FliH/SctL family protein [Peptococcaceae bacterium]